ncbi:MAG: hypothetical protein ABSF18_01515, partial [Gammaproteobacteria bacterium]
KAAFTFERRSNRVHWRRLRIDKQQMTAMENDPAVKQFLCGKILEVFRSGSQIHQNNAFLLHLGMPLVKLDGFYRGPFSEEDVLIITKNLPEIEARELQTLLFSKSYGKDALHGWKKYLYIRGFL